MKTTKTKKYLIIGSILVLIGITGYLAYKKYKIKKEEKNNNANNPLPVVNEPVIDTNNTNQTANPFKSKEEIQTFQKWVINIKGDKTILGNTKDDGNWGPNTSKAWNKYGVEYLAAITQTNKVKVDFIYSWIQKHQTSEDLIKTKVTINSIQSLPAGLIDVWYLHCKNTVENNKKWTFVYNNQTYYSLTGKMILNYNPLVTNYRINKGAYVFEDSADWLSFIKSPSEGAIGKPTLIFYQSHKNIVWCYFPNLGFGGEYKYIATTNLIKV